MTYKLFRAYSGSLATSQTFIAGNLKKRKKEGKKRSEKKGKARKRKKEERRKRKMKRGSH